MTHDLKPFQFCLFMFTYLGLLLCNRNLLFNRIHSLKIGKQTSPLLSLCDDHTVALTVQLVRRIYFLRISQHIDTTGKHI